VSSKIPLTRQHFQEFVNHRAVRPSQIPMKQKEAGTKPPLKWKQPMKFWNEISWAVFHFFNKK